MSWSESRDLLSSIFSKNLITGWYFTLISQNISQVIAAQTHPFSLLQHSFWGHIIIDSLFQLPINVEVSKYLDDENFLVISQQIGSLCVCYYPQVYAHFAPVFLQLTTEKILAWLYGIFVIHPWQMTLFRTHFFIPQFLFHLMNGIEAA